MHTTMNLKVNVLQQQLKIVKQLIFDQHPCYGERSYFESEITFFLPFFYQSDIKINVDSECWMV